MCVALEAGSRQRQSQGTVSSLEFDFGLGQMEDKEGEDLDCFPGRGDSDSKSTGFQKREFKKAHLLQ